MRKNLISFKKRTFLDSFVKYMTCKEFPPTMVFKLDLSFLPDEFFGCEEKVTRTLGDKLGIESPSHHKQVACDNAGAWGQRKHAEDHGVSKGKDANCSISVWWSTVSNSILYESFAT
jgi:hypothetical protein